MMKQALVEGVTRCLYASLNLPCARKLSLAKKIKLPNMKSSPAQQEASEMVLEVKKKKKPPMVNRTRMVPQRSSTYLIGSVPVRLLLRVLILKKENITITSQIMIQRGYVFSTLSIETLFYARSSAIYTKAVTQKMCPIRKLKAPKAKHVKLSPHSNSISPAEPNSNPMMIVVICLWISLRGISCTTMIHTGTALTYLRKLFIWSESPMRQSMLKRTKRASRTMYTVEEKNGFECDEYILFIFYNQVLFQDTKVGRMCQKISQVVKINGPNNSLSYGSLLAFPPCQEGFPIISTATPQRRLLFQSQTAPHSR